VSTSIETKTSTIEENSVVTPVISVVVPVYGAAGVLKILHGRLSNTLSMLGEPYEIVFVEDSSPDQSWVQLEEIATGDSYHIRAIKLSKNYGQQAAITAGLTYARGQWAVVMDCDLQDLPEFIPQLFSKAKEGYDIVWARRTQKWSASVRTLLSKIYFNLLSAVAKVNIDDSTGAFTIISREVINAYLEFSDQNRHYKLILLWLGFRQGYVAYDRPMDANVKSSSYTLSSLVKTAMDGLFFQSTVLLEWIIITGLLISLVGLIAAVSIVVQYFLCPTVLPGWTSVTVLLLLLGGSNLVAVGTVGLYVGQIFKQVKGRPLFIVEKSIN
jgi:polyisoprenyl-phosphate glycosyltransferase